MPVKLKKKIRFNFTRINFTCLKQFLKDGTKYETFENRFEYNYSITNLFFNNTVIF